MMTEFTQRLLTALLLIALTVAALYWLPTNAFQLITLLATTIAVLELSKLTQLTVTLRWLSVIALWTAGLLVVFSLLPLSAPHIALVGALFWLAMLIIMICRQALTVIKPGIMTAIIGLIVIFIAWLMLITIRETQGPFQLLAVLGLIWAADSGAYFAGKKFGKHKLAPTISPGKSIEGLIGGIGAGIIYVTILQLVGYPVVSWPVAIGLVIISVVGDLTESQLKRSANLKDSGTFLPGHGGFLDRTDSMISVLPCYLALHHFLSL